MALCFGCLEKTGKKTARQKKHARCRLHAALSMFNIDVNGRFLVIFCS